MASYTDAHNFRREILKQVRNAKACLTVPDGQIQDNLIEWYYDSSWQLCSDSQASYKMKLTLNETANSRQGTLTFYHATNDIQIYTIDLVFPIIENSDKEASS